MNTTVAISQMTSTACKANNLATCLKIIEKASKGGASLLCLPENFAFFPDGYAHGVYGAEFIDGPTISTLKNAAKESGLWLSLGGFQERIAGSQKIYNSHLVIDSQGQLVANYRKMHLFCATLSADENYDEGRSVERGEVVSIFKSPFFIGGLSVCYDLRFAYLYAALRKLGAQVLLIPAAFTDITGKAHWEVLLRARAIENQCFVLASAQIGQHNAKRITYGRAMIIDPWGQVMAQCQKDDDLAFAEIDLNYLSEIREKMPVHRHQRKVNE